MNDMDANFRSEEKSAVSGTNKFWRILKFEGLSFIAILFALFFANGYVYLETLNSKLGVPVSRLGFDGQIYAVYGGVNLLVLVTALLMVFTAVGAVSALMAFSENPDREKKPSNSKFSLLLRRFEIWASKRFKNAREIALAALYVGFVALVFFLLWKLTVASSVEKAERDAYKLVRDCEVANIHLKNMDVLTACIVGESDDALYLVFKSKEDAGVIYFDKGILPKDSVRSARGRASIKFPE